MNFKCRGCKEFVRKNSSPLLIPAANIHWTAYHSGWMECSEKDLQKPPAEREWVHTNLVPEVGQTRILQVWQPFDEEPGDLFTQIFEPWQMYLNGWDAAESPEDIGKACAVLCRFADILHQDEFEGLITVEVLNVVPLDDLYKLVPENVTYVRFFENFGQHEELWVEYKDERRLLRTWTAQGDVSELQLIYTDDNGRRHEVLTGWNSFHEDYYYICNNVNP